MEYRVPPSESIAAEEMTAYIGPRAESYRTRFERFTRTGTARFELSWNWPAAFAGMWWYLYRKMYGWALLDFVLGVLLGWTFFVPVLWGVARAVTGNYLYFRQADRKIREIRIASSILGAPGTTAVHLERLAAEGGVNRWVTWVAVAGTVLFLAILLSAFGWVWDAIPPLRDLWPGGPPGRWV